MAASGGANNNEVLIQASFLTTVAGAAAGGEFMGTMTVAGMPAPTIIWFMQLLAVQGYDFSLSGTTITVKF